MLGTGLALSLVAFFMVRDWQQSDLEKRAAELTRNHVEKLQISILRSMEVLHSIAALHAVEGRISRSTFHDFVQAALHRQPELQALSWNPVVPVSEREAFEAEAGASGLNGFVIREHSRAGQLVAAGLSREYVPVSWIEPMSGNDLALGFDLNSDSRRRECLEQARDSGRAVATSPIRLAQTGRSPGFLVLQPVYRGGAAPASVETRRNQLAGYAVAVFSVSNLVEGALAELHHQGIVACLLDDSAHGELIYGLAAFTGSSVLPLDAAGRRWVMSYEPTKEFKGSTAWWQAWLILAAGLGFTLLTTAYLYGGWRSSCEVANANRALREEVVVRQRAETAAAAANEAKSDFLASMSHEIRTPLNAILGYAQLLQRDVHLSPEQRDSLDGISVSGQHLLSLINEILDLSKIEAGRVDLNPTDLDLALLARSLGTTFKPLCAQKRIQFRMHLDAPGPTRVRGDEGKLRQVLINLIGNAVKFTRAGEVCLNIRAGAGGRWLFEVTDTGLGIPLEEQAEIFKPFHQGSGGQHQGGTGLGLAIAQRQVALLGGELKLDSDRGAGSRFFFAIPLDAPQTPGAEIVPKVARLAPGQRVHALIVDDRKENRAVLGGMLSAIGGELSLAASGDEALEAARNPSLQIVLLDWLMPGISGGALARQLLARSGGRFVIVAHSASVLPRHREEAFAAGCVDFITKPFRGERLYESLQQQLGTKFEYEVVVEPELVLPIDGLRVPLPEELCARLAVAAELHSTTALKGALQDLRPLGPEARALAEHIRQLMRGYDMDAIQHLLARAVVPVSLTKDSAPHADDES